MVNGAPCGAKSGKRGPPLESPRLPPWGCLRSHPRTLQKAPDIHDGPPIGDTLRMRLMKDGPSPAEQETSPGPLAVLDPTAESDDEVFNVPPRDIRPHGTLEDRLQ